MLALYCYAIPAGVPEGVEVRDAATILPLACFERYGRESASLFSNWFRYELQRRGTGTWVDSDIYLLKPIDGERAYLFGYEDESAINGAVLRLPPDAPLLAKLLNLFDERRIPPWLSRRQQLRAAWRLATRGRTGLSKMPWGVAGPKAITALAREEGVASWALPSRVFYPFHYTEADWILDPGGRIEGRVGDDTVSIHLWNEAIKHFKEQPAPPGSFLARLHAEGA
jgi:hypothetical protein